MADSGNSRCYRTERARQGLGLCDRQLPALNPPPFPQSVMRVGFEKPAGRASEYYIVKTGFE